MRAEVNNCQTRVGTAAWSIRPVHICSAPHHHHRGSCYTINFAALLPVRSEHFPIVRMKSAAAAVASVLRSNAWLELIMVFLAQINTQGPRSHSCGPLPGWPSLLWVLHSRTETERKQVRRKEMTIPGQSLQGLEGPKPTYFQIQVFPTPAGLQPAVCLHARKVFS